MKNTLYFVLMILALASCRSQEQVVYFQDFPAGSAVKTIPVQNYRLKVGDRFNATVTSSASPDHVAHYNYWYSQGGTGNISSQNNPFPYTIGPDGACELPGIGRIQLAGLTRVEAQDKLQALFRNGVLNDAIVSVTVSEQFVTLLGDTKAGKYEFKRDNMTLLELLGQAGDLNVTARRNKVIVFRMEGNRTKSYPVDLRSERLFQSPVYNLMPGDVVYIEPNKKQTNNYYSVGNYFATPGSYISIASFLMSLGVLILK